MEISEKVREILRIRRDIEYHRKCIARKEMQKAKIEESLAPRERRDLNHIDHPNSNRYNRYELTTTS